MIGQSDFPLHMPEMYEKTKTAVQNKENETDRICLVGIVTCHSHILAAPFYSKCVSILSHDSIELFDVYQQAIAATYMI